MFVVEYVNLWQKLYFQFNNGGAVTYILIFPEFCVASPKIVFYRYCYPKLMLFITKIVLLRSFNDSIVSKTQMGNVSTDI